MRLDGNGDDDTDQGIASFENYLHGHKASYHKGCMDDHNDRMVARAEAHYKKHGEQSSSTPDDGLKSPPGKRLFNCDEYVQHNAYRNIREMQPGENY